MRRLSNARENARHKVFCGRARRTLRFGVLCSHLHLTEECNTAGPSKRSANSALKSVTAQSLASRAPVSLAVFLQVAQTKILDRHCTCVDNWFERELVLFSLPYI